MSSAPALLNTPYGLHICGDDPSFYRHMLGMMLDSPVCNLASLDAALTAGDLLAACRQAHSLKGMAASIGAELLRDAAAALEYELRQEAPDLASIPPLKAAMTLQLAASLATIKAYLAKI